MANKILLPINLMKEIPSYVSNDKFAMRRHLNKYPSFVVENGFKYQEFIRVQLMCKLTMRGDLPNFITNDIPAYLKANGVDMSPKYVRYIKYLKGIISNKTYRIIMNMK